jgi:hypothetical protein
MAVCSHNGQPNSSAVITPVLQPLQTSHEDWRGLAIADVCNDATHVVKSEAFEAATPVESAQAVSKEHAVN